MVLVSNVLNMCDVFYKQATIETDMAKRIMLSVIPAISSPTERHMTGGYDWLALKSAVRGAIDIIKYGTKACVEEMEHFGATFRFDEHGDFPTGETNVKRKNALEIARQSRVNLANSNYIDCLAICLKAFKQTDGWEEAFGGEAWAKIADILLQIAKQWQHLTNLRAESNNPETRNKNTDYFAEEFKTMKDLIVLLNVFDGLAHNTDVVMPKLISLEYKDLNPSGYGSRHSEVKKQYKERVLRLMDAKELDNPVDVYREVEGIISQSPNKYTFQDWIKRLQQHPDYKSDDPDARKIKLEKIKAKKDMIMPIFTIKNNLPKIEKYRNISPNKCTTYLECVDKLVLYNSFSDDLYWIKDAAKTTDSNYEKYSSPVKKHIMLLLESFAYLFKICNDIRGKISYLNENFHSLPITTQNPKERANIKTAYFNNSGVDKDITSTIDKIYEMTHYIERAFEQL